MLYRIIYNGQPIGTSRLESDDQGIAFGRFDASPGYESVRPVFLMYVDALGATSAEKTDQALLDRYYTARDALNLCLETDTGELVSTHWIHIENYEDYAEESRIVSAEVTDRAFWQHRLSLTLLRQHVEACWGVRLPPLAPGDNEILHGPADAPAHDAESAWALYWAETALGAVRIWRPDVDADRRAALLERATQTWTQPADHPAPDGISREVALSLVASPRLSLEDAARTARQLTAIDIALLERFEPGESAYYTDPTHAPVLGAIAVGRLVSVAHSSRRTAEACELGINTLPEARRRGYALAATVLWTDMVRSEGREPIYSARADNAASLALAHAAGYRPFARAVYLI